MTGSLELDLFEELKGIPTIDAHEHLPPEEECLGTPPDFYTLFENYCADDLRSSGATPEDMAALADRALPLAKRWARFRPFLGRIRTGGYARAALVVVREILGFDDLTDDTYEAVSAKLRETRKPGLYDAILRDRCNIAACIECWCLEKGPYPDYFYHLAPGPAVVDVTSQRAIDRLSEECHHAIHNLGDVLTCMTRTVERWRANPKVVGVKSSHAYERSLAFQRVTAHEAETVFDRIRTNEKNALSAHEALPLQDFLMFELLARLEAVHLPVVFHTGLQAGSPFPARIQNANPLLLQPLIEEFPRVRIDLFHGGMPWVREIAILAKQFPGVHLNMAWMHVISPAQSRSALSEWLDLVPNTKIFGFGGDYWTIEKVYGHLTLARRNIAAVLADQITSGAMSRAEAGLVARRLMLDNPREFYGLPA